jgi:uncharacterized protein (DUF952 family)
MIYHIANKSLWQQAQKTGAYTPETFEVEGFIHMSTKDQVSGVLDRYYANQADLVLLFINENQVTPELKYEKATNDELFPHFYGPLNLEAVVKTYEGDYTSLKVLSLNLA